MYAGRKQWELGKITVGLRFSRDADGTERIDRRLSFGKALTAEQKEKLLEIAGKTPVTKTLAAGVRIESSIAE